MSTKHAAGPQEHALCGLAEDAHESGDWHEPVVMAKPGESVTCKECRDVIDFIRLNFNRYKQS